MDFMKAMLLRHHGMIESSPLQLSVLPIPDPAEGEVLIQVSACGICRTDLHVIERDLPPEKMPIVPGHQVVGRVVRVGTGARRFAIGQRVGVAWLASACGRCEFCNSSRENLCEHQRFTGYHRDGGFAEYTMAREDFVYPIPAAVSDLEVAPFLCSGIIGYRAFKRAELPPQGTLGIFGFGSSAHLTMQLALKLGHRVLVVTRGEKHQRLAREMGAAWAGESADRLPEKYDSAILFAPAGELVPGALASLKKGGTLAVAGIHLSDIPPLNYEHHLFYEKNLRSVTANTREDGRELLALAERLEIRPRLKRYPLEKANQALIDLKHDRIEGSAVLTP